MLECSENKLLRYFRRLKIGQVLYAQKILSAWIFALLGLGLVLGLIYGGKMPTVIKGNVVTRQQAADTFGVTVITIDNWVRRGCPYVMKGGRGKAWSFNTADLFEWRLQLESANSSSYDDIEDNEELDLKIKIARLRLTDAQAENEEIKARLASNKAIDADILAHALAEVLGITSNKLLSLPERLESTLVGETDKDVFKKVLTAELKDAMYAVCDGVDETIEKLRRLNNE